MGTLDTVTADICSWPTRPTMKVSIKPREVVIRFCSTTGRAKVKTLR